MNRIGLSYVINMGILVLVGWWGIEYFHMATGFANSIRNEKQTLNVVMDLTPTVLICIVGIGLLIG